MSTHTASARVLGLVVSALVVGCGPPQMDYSKVELIPAHGTVTLDGQPLSGAVVVFESKDGQFSYALTDDAGGYTLQFDSVEQGVTPGAKTVRISTARKIVGLNAGEEGEGEGGESASEGGASPTPAAKELVPAKYNKSSELKVEVTPDKTEYNFDLTSN